MTTPEDRLSALESWVNQNRESVSMFYGLVTSVNGRLETIAQRVATNENAVATVAAAVQTVNDTNSVE